MLKTDWHNENREELNGIAIEQTDALRGLERVNSITELRKVVKGNILKINRKNMSYDGIMFKRNPSTPHVTFQYNTNYQQMIINHEHHRQDKPVHDRQVLRCLTHKEIDISEGRQLGKCENEHMGNQ